MHPAVVMVMLRRGRRIVLMLGRRARGRHAGRLGIIAAGAAGPQRLGTVVKVTGRRGSLHHEVENRRAAHHLDGPLERKINEPLPIAPDYDVAGLQARRSSGTALSRTLRIFISKTMFCPLEKKVSSEQMNFITLLKFMSTCIF